jgi:glycosyltransferase involved in cell wall biosynthesis
MASVRCDRAIRIYTHRAGATIYPLKRRIRYKIAGALLRRYFNGFSGNTQHACTTASRLFNIPSAAWNVTYNGLEFSMLEPSQPKECIAQHSGIQLGKKMIIGTSAKLRAWKRIDILLTACAKMTSDAYQLLIVGDGPDRVRLEQLSKQLGLEDRTRFVGLQEHVGDYLSLMDVFVLPSRQVESFGNAVVEAMSQGVPGIVFHDGGGLSEHVEHGKSGFIVSSMEELANRLEELIRSPELRKLLGHHAAESMRSRYTLEAMAQGYESLYRASLGRQERQTG